MIGPRLRFLSLGVGLALALSILVTGCSLPDPFASHTDNTGRILFGFGFHRVSAYQIDIEHTRTTFYPGQSIAWVAYLSRPARAASLTISIHSLKTKRIYISKPVPISNPKFNVLADSQPVRAFKLLHVPIHGGYVLRYSRGSTVLAQGIFRLKR